jgi:hypothetical protein
MVTTDPSKMIEKHFGKKVCTEKLNIEGYKRPIQFDIYDGYAVCPDYRGHCFEMEYPSMKAIKDSTEFSDAIMDYVSGINNVDEISVLHVLITFATLYKDGVEVVAK